MAVRSRGNGFQADFSFEKRRYRQDFPTRAEAVAWENETKHYAKSSTPRPSGSTDDRRGLRLQAAFDQLYDRVWKGQKSADTHESNYQTVVDIMGDVYLKSIDADMIDRLVHQLEKRNYAPATVNRKLASLSKLLNFAHRRGWIPSIPSIERKREPQGRIRFFSQPEEDAIVGYLRQTARTSMADFVEFLMDSGLRRGEALALETSDVLGGLTVVHHGKTKSATRSVPQTDRVRVLVSRRLLARPHGETRLFWDLTKNIVEHMWVAARTALGKGEDKEWVIHTCRHTFVSRLVQRGESLTAVMGLAGHSSITVTQRYAHLAAHHYVQAMKSLEPQNPAGPQVYTSGHIAMM